MGDAICIAFGILIVTISVLVLKAYLPGASFLLLDQDGFTLRSYNRVQRLEWRSISRMIALGRSYSRNSSSPPGIRIIPKADRTPAFLIPDQYTVRRHELLAMMSDLAGPSVAIGFPETSPQDWAFTVRLHRFGYWAIGSMFAVVMAGFVVVELRRGKPLADLLLYVVGLSAWVCLLCWVNSRDGRNG